MDVCADVWSDALGVLDCRCKDYGGGVSNCTPVTANASSEITLRTRSRYFCDKQPGILNLFTI